MEATFDDASYVLEPGDVAWAGAGCVHGFRNVGDGPVRWLETQAPQPPPRHSYRFARDWDYLRATARRRRRLMRTVVIGGTSGIGLEVARDRAARGDEVVLTGRDPDRAAEVAASVGDSVSGIAVDLNETHGLADALAGVGEVDRLVVAAIERDQNTIAEYDVDRATRLAVLKLVGYTEVIHTLLPRMNPESSVVLFGGRAKDRPYPGSITVSTVNGGVVGLVNALALEMAPIRVNALHPGIVGDSPFWAGKPDERAGRLRLADADQAAGLDGGHRRRGRLPAREPQRQRHQPVRRRRVAGHVISR